MYAISFPGFCGSYEEIHGWSQSHYVDFIVKHHVNHFRFQSLSTLSMVAYNPSMETKYMYVLIFVSVAGCKTVLTDLTLWPMPIMSWCCFLIVLTNSIGIMLESYA